MSETPIGTTSRRWQRRNEASEYLREEHGVQLSPATLAKLAVIGGGPPFRLDGRFPVYDRDDLDIYAIERLGPLRRSTSDNGQLAGRLKKNKPSRDGAAAVRPNHSDQGNARDRQPDLEVHDQQVERQTKSDSASQNR